MPKMENVPTILQKAFAEWSKQEILRKNKPSIKTFADFLGYSKAIVNFWMNGKRKISERTLFIILPKLVELLGTEIYIELDIQKPDPYKEYILKNWDSLPAKKQKEIIKIIQNYIDNIPKNTGT